MPDAPERLRWMRSSSRVVRNFWSRVTLLARGCWRAKMNPKVASCAASVSLECAWLEVSKGSYMVGATTWMSRFQTWACKATEEEQVVTLSTKGGRYWDAQEMLSNNGL